MIKYTFTKFTKWNVLKKLIVQEIDDLIIGSIWIVAFMSFLVGGVVAIQTALNSRALFYQEILLDLQQDNQ